KDYKNFMDLAKALASLYAALEVTAYDQNTCRNIITDQIAPYVAQLSTLIKRLEASKTVAPVVPTFTLPPPPPPFGQPQPQPQMVFAPPPFNPPAAPPAPAAQQARQAQQVPVNRPILMSPSVLPPPAPLQSPPVPSRRRPKLRRIPRQAIVY